MNKLCSQHSQDHRLSGLENVLFQIFTILSLCGKYSDVQLTNHLPTLRQVQFFSGVKPKFESPAQRLSSCIQIIETYCLSTNTHASVQVLSRWLRWKNSDSHMHQVIFGGMTNEIWRHKQDFDANPHAAYWDKWPIQCRRLAKAAFKHHCIIQYMNSKPQLSRNHSFLVWVDM